MNALILQGESVAKNILAELRPRVAEIAARRGNPPLLAILSIGADPSSALYLKRKLDACREIGVESSVQSLSAESPETEIHQLLQELAQDSGVDGILIETPLPKRISLPRLLERLSPEKDAEGLTPANFGRLFAAKTMAEIEAGNVLIPPTAHAILRLLLESRVPIAGKEAVVVGRSNIVGKPAAHLLSCLDATVVICHSRTLNLASHLKRADIVVSAVGRPRTILGKDLKPGAVVLDAGISYEGKTLSGDCDGASVRKKAGYLSPVPGGVGPVTVAMLLSNVVTAAERRMRRNA